MLTIDKYLNVRISLDYLFWFLFFHDFILFCSSTTRREEIDRVRKRMFDIQELGLL